MPISQHQSATAIWYKLLWFCYYNARFAMVVFGVKQSKVTVIKNLKVTLIQNYEIHNIKDSEGKKCHRKELALRAHMSKTILGLHILIRLVLCLSFMYLVFQLLVKQNKLYSLLVYTQVITIIICPSVMSIVEIWHNERIVQALNVLFHLIRYVDGIQCSYEIFHWTHVIFAANTAVTFIYEIVVACQGVLMVESMENVILLIIQYFLLAEIWLNIHAVTLLYVTIDALYGALNHYMRHEFIPRLQAVQIFGHVITEAQIDGLIKDMDRLMDLFKSVQRMGSELHSLWQVPVATTLVCICFSVLGVVHKMVWQYYQEGVIHMRLYQLTFKLIVDILLLSLAAHKAIKSSRLIGCMGLENAMLVQNDKWHKQMDQFLYHINLYELKFNFIGLFDISNAFTLTFMGCILTAISIFIPFSAKTNRLH